MDIWVPLKENEKKKKITKGIRMNGRGVGNDFSKGEIFFFSLYSLSDLRKFDRGNSSG